MITENPVGGWCDYVASSPCGCYIAAGAGADIVIVSSSGEMLQNPRGHDEGVRCVAFVPGCEKIVSGTEPGKVIVWERKSSRTAVHGLNGHGRAATNLSESSGRGRACSCAGDGNRMIALGLRDGKLSVLDWETKDVLFEDIEAAYLRKASISSESTSFAPQSRMLPRMNGESAVLRLVQTARMWLQN